MEIYCKMFIVVNFFSLSSNLKILNLEKVEIKSNFVSIIWKFYGSGPLNKVS
jgi:hypothetical protein